VIPSASACLARTWLPFATAWVASEFSAGIVLIAKRRSSSAERRVRLAIYDGWKFDVYGNITEMPSEPQESGFANRVKHKAYRVREGGGFVGVYMGAAPQAPPFEPPP
jgi:hypothetical protein